MGGERKARKSRQGGGGVSKSIRSRKSTSKGLVYGHDSSQSQDSSRESPSHSPRSMNSETKLDPQVVDEPPVLYTHPAASATQGMDIGEGDYYPTLNTSSKHESNKFDSVRSSRSKSSSLRQLTPPAFQGSADDTELRKPASTK
jgi:hypothetical protein